MAIVCNVNRFLCFCARNSDNPNENVCRPRAPHAFREAVSQKNQVTTRRHDTAPEQGFSPFRKTFSLYNPIAGGKGHARDSRVGCSRKARHSSGISNRNYFSRVRGRVSIASFNLGERPKRLLQLARLTKPNGAAPIWRDGGIVLCISLLCC
jgi:hypothetical protein